MDYASHAPLPSLGARRSDIFECAPAGRLFRSVAAQKPRQKVVAAAQISGCFYAAHRVACANQAFPC